MVVFVDYAHRLEQGRRHAIAIIGSHRHMRCLDPLHPKPLRPRRPLLCIRGELPMLLRLFPLHLSFCIVVVVAAVGAPPRGSSFHEILATPTPLVTSQILARLLLERYRSVVQ